MHLVNWDEVCRPRANGGLGIRKARDFNDALLTKVAWHMIVKPDKPWVKIMHEKYIKGGSFFSALVPS